VLDAIKLSPQPGDDEVNWFHLLAEVVDDFHDSYPTEAPYLAARLSELRKGREHTRAALNFVSLSDLLKEPEEAVRWLVDGLLPAGGTSVLAGKAESG